jgi:hypothetical protein
MRSRIWQGVLAAAALAGPACAASGPVTPDDFAPAGAHIGDGVTDATNFVQAAFDSGRPVRCVAGETYLVYGRGYARPLQNSAQPFALRLPAGLHFDGKGCRIKLAVDHSSSVVPHVLIAAGNDDVPTPGIVLSNVTIDEQGSAQPHTAANPAINLSGNWTGGLQLINTPGLRISNLTVTDGFGYCGYFAMVHGFVFRDMTCNGAHGIGWYYGSDVPGFALYDGTITNTSARNVAGDYWNSTMPGAGAVYVVTNCTITGVRSENNAGGEKIEGAQSTNSTFSNVAYAGGPRSSLNSGLKIQGDRNTGRFPSNITAKNVTSRDAPGAGLYDYASINSTIIGYRGTHNGTSNSYPDIWIEGENTTLQNWTSTDAVRMAIEIRAMARSPHVGPGSIVAHGVSTPYRGHGNQ